jgi:hypothetical protein
VLTVRQTLTDLKKYCCKISRNIAYLPNGVVQGVDQESIFVDHHFSGKAASTCDWSLFAKDPDYIAVISPNALKHLIPFVICKNDNIVRFLWRIRCRFDEYDISSDFAHDFDRMHGSDSFADLRSLIETVDEDIGNGIYSVR